MDFQLTEKYLTGIHTGILQQLHITKAYIRNLTSCSNNIVGYPSSVQLQQRQYRVRPASTVYSHSTRRSFFRGSAVSSVQMRTCWKCSNYAIFLFGRCMHVVTLNSSAPFTSLLYDFLYFLLRSEMPNIYTARIKPRMLCMDERIFAFRRLDTSRSALCAVTHHHLLANKSSAHFNSWSIKASILAIGINQILL